MIVNDIVTWREKRVLAIAHMAAVLKAGDRTKWGSERTVAEYVTRATELFNSVEAHGERE